MRKVFCGAAASAALVTAAFTAQAQSGEAIELAKRLVASSGLAAQLQSIPGQIEQDLAQMRGKVPDEMLDAMAGAARESFRPALLEDDIVRAVAKALPSAEMRQALAWLDTDAGRRVTRAEEGGAGSATLEALHAYAQDSKRRPPSAKRTALLKGLVEATTAVESSVALIESMALGVAVGMDAMQPQQKRIGVAALRSRLRQAMPIDALRDSMSAAMPGLFAFVYRDISDADLEAYLAFNRSVGGTRYNRVVMDAFTEALTRASIRVGTLVDGAMKRKSA